MMPPDFRQFAELWREQIGPEELAQLQARAKTIARGAKWRWRLDFVLTAVCLGLTAMFLWINTTSPQVKLGFALLAAGAVWFAWRRRQLATASRAIAVDDPRNFFETAIKNLRAEMNLSTLSLYSMVPVLFLCYLLVSSTRRVYGIEFILMPLRERSLTRTIAVVVIFIGVGAYLVRDYIKLRRQLRRLESMRREWDDQSTRDVEDGP